MSLVLYNTLSRHKERFEPLDPGRVRMYVCGPTVYDLAHIGNGRAVVVFDQLYRVLRDLYGAEHVRYVRNITDVEDKIIAAARENGEPIDALTRRTTEAFHADMAALNNLPPDVEPRATEYIAQMLALIERLIASGNAYAAEGHVLFRVASFAKYGALSQRNRAEMIAGARVEVAPYKRHPADFVLWKPSKPGEPVWESPFGPGRPGWHIECSAMIEEVLGLPIDIHGGGNDLIFPHHENELAQGVCSHQGGGYANYWLHNGMLNMDAEKMSKSLGNVELVHDMVGRFPGEALRWALLASHYRQPSAWTDEAIAQARAALDNLYGALRRARDVPAEGDAPSEAFMEALLDDLNTPRANAELFALARRLETGAPAERARAKGELLAGGALIGFLQADPEAWFHGGADEALTARIDALIARRVAARAAKDWASADAIRAELTALNVEVMDNPTGATWRLKESA